uniref:Pol polyprotein n=1 Tax=Cajanus cajan TaxID=3821 RepID=A0A151TSA9_CAJCA|nr:Pol polyprotein [Cajanus cajan]
MYADNINALPTFLNVLSPPWPFSMWEMDVVEAASYAHVTRNVVAKFINKEFICRYGMPSRIITNNRTNLNNKMMTELCVDFKIQHHNSSPYRPKMNGAVKATNKNIKKSIQKMVVTYKDWDEMLPFALHEQQTRISRGSSTGATPFTLVYGMEAVLPIKVEIPSLRVLTEAKLGEAERVQTSLDQIKSH